MWMQNFLFKWYLKIKLIMVRRVKTFLLIFWPYQLEKWPFSPLCHKRSWFHPNCPVPTPSASSLYSHTSFAPWIPTSLLAGTEKQLKTESAFPQLQRVLLRPCSPASKHSQDSSAKSLPNKWKWDLKQGLIWTEFHWDSTRVFSEFKVLIFQGMKMCDLVNRKLHTAGSHVLKQPSKQSEVTG